MSKHFQKVMREVKTKMKALGFSRKELESVASNIDDNLTIEDDASDEDIASAITEAVDAAMPYLKIAQKSASRQTKAALEAAKGKDDDDEDESDDDDDSEDEEDEKTVEKQHKKRNRRQAKSENTEIMKLLEAMSKRMEKQDEVINALKQNNTSDKRKTRLEKVLKDTGSFGKRILRQFDKMKFDSDDDFNDFLDEVKEDLEEANQERANAGLAKLGSVPKSEKKDKEEKVEEITDAELDKLADML